jgi:hypothetical protein
MFVYFILHDLIFQTLLIKSVVQEVRLLNSAVFSISLFLTFILIDLNKTSEWYDNWGSHSDIDEVSVFWDVTSYRRFEVFYFEVSSPKDEGTILLGQFVNYLPSRTVISHKSLHQAKLSFWGVSFR